MFQIAGMSQALLAHRICGVMVFWLLILALPQPEVQANSSECIQSGFLDQNIGASGTM